MLTPAERVFRKIAVAPNGCWEWTGARDRCGYGFLTVKAGLPKKKTYRAPRFAYEALVGPIPEGLVIDHLCRNRACVNPDHLEPVTQTVNLQRSGAVMRMRTHCREGHEYTPENTLVNDGRRRCRTCKLTRQAAAYRAAKEAAA